MICCQSSCKDRRTLFLKSRNSVGVKVSAFPMTGMTFTRGDNRRISSISISRRLTSALDPKLDAWSLRVPGRLDKVEQSVNSIIPESGVSLDPRLFSQDIIILSLKICSNLLETDVSTIPLVSTHQCSLSIPSPKPGVSTIVKAILAPSSSNSMLCCLIRIGSSS